jgi:hypothetical protein
MTITYGFVKDRLSRRSAMQRFRIKVKGRKRRDDEKVYSLDKQSLKDYFQGSKLNQ